MATLRSCRIEIAGILRELYSIESDVRTSASGIGQDNCAASIGKIILKYENVQRKLNNVNQNLVADFINGEE